jgi:hypothetical protein
MASSNLLSIVDSVIGSRKEKIAKEVYGYEASVSTIEKRLNTDGIVYRGPALQAIKALFRYHLEPGDYREIERLVGYNIK